LIGALLALCVGASSASALNVGSAQTVAGSVGLAGVACPDAGDCLAVGNASDTAGGIAPVANGIPGSARAVSGTVLLASVACVTGGGCLAAGQAQSTSITGTSDSGVLVAISGTAAGSPETVSGALDLLGVACAGSTACVSVGEDAANDQGVVLGISGGVGGGDVGTPTKVPGTARLIGVACTGSGGCFATGTTQVTSGGTTKTDEGAVVPISTAGVPTGPVVAVPGSVALGGIACADATDCFAVGSDASGDGIVVPIIGGVVQAAVTAEAGGELVAVSCSGSTDCFAVGGNVVVPITGGAVQPALTVPGGAADFRGIACSNSSECVAAGGTSGGTVVDLLISGTPGDPTATITTPSADATYAFDDPTHPVFDFNCQAAFGGSLASAGGCVAALSGAPSGDSTVTGGQAIDTSAPGTFTLTLTATEAGAGGQTATAVSKYTVVPAPQTIAFPQPAPFKYPHGSVSLTATASSGLSVAYSLRSGRCTLTGSTLTFDTGYGSCEVAADQAGNADYDAAPEVTSTITITPPAPPSCTGQAVSVQNSTATVITLGCTDAAADSGDALTFAIGAQPADGTLSAINPANGEVIYTPTGAYGGPDEFTFYATDTQGSSNLGTVSITVTPQAAPANTGAPGISGSPQIVGQTLTCSPGTWSGGLPQTYAYQWLRDGAAIAGASAVTYGVQAGDQGHTLACEVTATNSGGSAGATSASVAVPSTTPLSSMAGPAASAPASLAPPVISGTVAVDRGLSCSTGAWSGTLPQTYGYAWRRDGIAIPGATRATYLVSAKDAGSRLTCAVTSTNSAGSATAQSRAVAVAPSNVFRLVAPTFGRTGSITVKLDAPGPGRFEAIATFPAKRTTAKAKRAAATPDSTTYGRASLEASKAGEKKLTIRPTKTAARLLEMYGSLRVTISITFTPTGGPAGAKTASLTVRHT
jgi:Bacterial Ig domain